MDQVDYLVLDVSYVAHRHAHAMARFATTDGRRSGHIFGAFKSIRSLSAAFKPRHLVFVYDRGSPWRRELVPEYKASRRPVDSVSEIETGYVEQALAQPGDIRLPPPPLANWTPAPEVERLFRSFPGIHIAAPDCEADDCAAWFLSQVAYPEKRTGPIAFHTGDRDYYQLVSDLKKQYTLITKKPKPKAKSLNVVIDEQAVVEEFGVLPNAIARYKALLGDPSDNIQGVLGGVRPGKREALKLYASHASSLTYFDKDRTIDRIDYPPEIIPQWLGDVLDEERTRILNNLEVCDLTKSATRVPASAIQTQTGDVANALGVLIEFECESLLAQVEPFFDILKRPTFG
jgi:DNA polymerase-1